MSGFTRRTFNRSLGATVALGALVLPGSAPFAAGTKAQVVVVGGGFGGATAAKYIKRFDPSISVTLVEPSTHFITCPFSNTVIGWLPMEGGCGLGGIQTTVHVQYVYV